MPNRIEQLIHDARGPLNTISVNAEVAKLLIQKPGSTEALLAAMQNILHECQRCNAILLRLGNENPDVRSSANGTDHD